MEILYKVEGTILYEDYAVVGSPFYIDYVSKVQNFIEVLQRTENIPAKLIVKPRRKETCKLGIQFSFYKKAKFEFVSDFLLLLSSFKKLESGEVFFTDSHNGEQHYVICDGCFISDEHCS